MVNLELIIFCNLAAFARACSWFTQSRRRKETPSMSDQRLSLRAFVTAAWSHPQRARDLRGHSFPGAVLSYINIDVTAHAHRSIRARPHAGRAHQRRATVDPNVHLVQFVVGDVRPFYCVAQELLFIKQRSV